MADVRLALLLLCACGRIGFEAAGRGGGDDMPLDDASLGDGSAADPDATAVACDQPGNGTTFPGGAQACTDWVANVNMVNATVTEAAGQLTVVPAPNSTGAQGGCLKNGVPFGTAGAIVEVDAVLTGSNTITAIQLGGGANALSMVVQNGALMAQDASGTLGSVTYSPTATKFWRIRPETLQIVFEYGDGSTWTKLATSQQAAPATYDTRLIAGELGGVPNPGEARFGSVNLCP